MPELEPITREEKFLNGEVGMTPITREEKILAGEDVETITRREYFLKKYRGGGGGDVTVVPLSVTENGTYSEEGKAYSPVQVEVPAPVLKTKNIMENGTYNASDDNADGYSSVEVDVPLPSNAYLLKSVTTPTPIASFTDGEEMVMPSLKVAIEPVQNLHGYDAPWAGGSGKNKLKYPYYASSTTINGVTFTVNDNGTVNVNGTASADASFYLAYTGSDMVLPQGEYTLNGCPSGGSNTTYMLNITNVSTQDIGSGANFTSDGTTSLNIRIIVRANTTTSNLLFKPMIRLASVTDASFAPYSNICPISGWSEANVGVVDMIGLDIVDSWLTSIGEAHSVDGDTLTINYITLKPFDNPCTLFDDDRTVNISVDSITGVATGVKIQLLDKNNTQVGQVTNSSKTFTGVGSKIRIDYGGGGQTIIKGLQIYSNGQTYNIDLDETRYGGEVDVVNGIVTPAPYYASYNGETLTGEWISDRDKYEVGATPTIGAQVVNIGASGTPVSILPTVIKSLRGVNNLWANTGDIKDAEYFSKEV